ncbi:hypothetical protein Taro_018207 [Colocasia esculenta]|uniref:Uncharacterized protein n=1 Tax=Colocasia esculenta TaxID=4460 RepID=A0A843UT89_COLES|nr:hypothetical protein [Colocasia esculenta]
MRKGYVSFLAVWTLVGNPHSALSRRLTKKRGFIQPLLLEYFFANSICILSGRCLVRWNCARNTSAEPRTFRSLQTMQKMQIVRHEFGVSWIGARPHRFSSAFATSGSGSRNPTSMWLSDRARHPGLFVSCESSSLTITISYSLPIQKCSRRPS